MKTVEDFNKEIKDKLHEWAKVYPEERAKLKVIINNHIVNNWPKEIKSDGAVAKNIYKTAWAEVDKLFPPPTKPIKRYCAFERLRICDRECAAHKYGDKNFVAKCDIKFSMCGRGEFPIFDKSEEES